MTVSPEQITDLMNGITELKGFFEAERTELEAARQNLKAQIGYTMFFSGTVDAANADPDPDDGGTFATVKALIDKAPMGALVRVKLMAGQTYDLDANIGVGNRLVRIQKEGAAANPVIRSVPYVNGTENYSYWFVLEGGEIVFNDIDIDLSVPKADPAYGWSIGRAALVTWNEGFASRVGFSGGTVTGADNRGLVTGRVGNAVSLSLYDCTFDGACHALVDAANTAAVIGKTSVLFQNGATLTDGGLWDTANTYIRN